MTDSLARTGTFHLPASIPLTADSSTITILIVDDDPAFRYLCTRVLNDDPAIRYTILEANSSTEALELFDPDIVDCALFDFNLPDEDGCELMRMIHQRHPNWFGPIVIITAGGNEEIAVSVMRNGAADYIAKQAIAKSSIQRAMANALEKAKLKRAIYERNRDLEAINNELESRNNEISRFYHRVSHEIKTPLTAAQMLISMVHEGLVGPITEDQKSIVGQAIESCEELTTLFNDLVECTRMDAGKLTLKPKLGSLENAVRRAVLSVSPVAQEKGISLEHSVDEGLPELMMDSGRIVQVLANLLGNAIKFTASGGQVSIHATRSESDVDWVEIAVADNGAGIEEQHLAHIFDRLYQVADVGDDSSGAGLGLGLTIASDLIRLHEGAINVRSNAGVGSVFTVLIPLNFQAILSKKKAIS